MTEVSDPLEENDTADNNPPPAPLGCPICNRQLVLDNVNFNKHVDECLNKVEVKEILKTQLEMDRLESLGSNSSTHHHRPSANKRLKR